HGARIMTPKVGCIQAKPAPKSQWKRTFPGWPGAGRLLYRARKRPHGPRRSERANGRRHRRNTKPNGHPHGAGLSTMAAPGPRHDNPGQSGKEAVDVRAPGAVAKW